jgi:hypothetical protein
MGILSKTKHKLRGALNKLSGEHSAAAPSDRQDYARPGVSNEEAEVVMANLRRPGAARSKQAAASNKKDREPTKES